MDSFLPIWFIYFFFINLFISIDLTKLTDGQSFLPNSGQYLNKNWTCFASKIEQFRIFAVTVLATLPIRTASQGESFAFIAPLFSGLRSSENP